MCERRRRGPTGIRRWRRPTGLRRRGGGTGCVHSWRHGAGASMRGLGVRSLAIGRGKGCPSAGGAEAEVPIELLPVRELSALQLARDAAPLQHQHAVGELGDEVEVLLHQQDRQPPGFLEPGEDPRHLVDDRGLDALGGLVEQEKLGARRQAARERQKLLLAAREHLALPVEERLEPREVGQQRIERRPLVTVAVVRSGEVEVLAHRQPRKDPPALGHVADAETRAFVRGQAGDVGPVVAHRSGGCGQEAHQGLQQRGLPHAVVAEDAHHLPFADVEIDAVQDRHPAVPAAEPPRLQADGSFFGRHAPSRRGALRAMTRGAPAARVIPSCPGTRRAPSDPPSRGRRGPPSAPRRGERR